MKKLKKLWQENAVLIVLGLIVLACVIAIVVVVMTYFVGTNGDKYGDRLDGIENYPFESSTQKEIISSLEDDESIDSASIEVSGKTIYLTIEFTPGLSLEEAQSKALGSLDLFSEDTLSFYDIEFLISADATDETEGFQIMGSHNVTGTGGIVWNNNTEVDTEEESEE